MNKIIPKIAITMILIGILLLVLYFIPKTPISLILWILCFASIGIYVAKIIDNL